MKEPIFDKAFVLEVLQEHLHFCEVVLQHGLDAGDPVETTGVVARRARAFRDALAFIDERAVDAAAVPDPEPGRLDELLIFDDACSVTMFEMHFQMHRDGRERGVWVRLQDTSEARAETYKTWLDNSVDTVAKMLGFDEDKMKKFSMFMHMNSEIKPLLNGQVKEAALLEWPEVRRMYDVLGVQLRAHGHLPPLARSVERASKPKTAQKRRRS